ncbi:hypothetical protein WJ32_24920 [Burkholderia ubonensis]|uniref:Uncharacterized protein n=1 Tax=Burkholderia ubonensis TaxID=101571 RepID=A0A118HMT2_9BURK|nr:hypothetical protein [Burkholderia ubonensis]AOJ65691.1 hypothetical protein WJ32_24920 [Burkholderia ubonensis]KVG58131.1 hypothetical protein WJ33_34295 [Burkholderia ubonensis]
MKRATIGHAARHARRDYRGGRALLAAIVADGFAPGCLGCRLACHALRGRPRAAPSRAFARSRRRG